MERVSVIMGVYNTDNEDMLIESINSILMQEYENLEFIICDDGSTDNTYTILSKLAKDDSRIKLIKNEKNEGLAATLNKCIDLANGKYIVRQDADDYSSLNRIREQVEFLEKNQGYDFVGNNICYFNDQGIWGEYRLKEYPEKEDFLFRVPFIHGTIMLKKESLIMCGKYYVAKETRRCEDYDLFMRMYSKGLRGHNIQKKLYYVREDQEAVERRKFVYRIDEVKVRYRGFKEMGILKKGMLFIAKPIVIGCMPKNILEYIKDIVYRRKNMR